MKPEDLVIGKQYLVFGKRRYYLGMTYEFDTLQYMFYHSLELSPGAVIHCLGADDVESDVTDSETLQEETMQVRKPEKIRLELKPEELIKALNTLGYDLTDYKPDVAYDLFAFGFVLKRREV